MGGKILMKGNEAIAEAAILAGCRHFFGYPITPQNEIPEYMSRRMPEVGGVFLQAESEVAGSNMVYGAACAGARVMTTSSSPGISLMQEAVSYMAGAELPCVLVNIVRGGPGLGGIQGSQADYFQATKGGGHGDYKLIVLAPASVQELMDLTITAFDLADMYRNPVMILGDAILGQMMEPVVPGRRGKADLPEKTWATVGAKMRPKNVITSLSLDPAKLEQHNFHLGKKYKRIADEQVRYKTYMTCDAETLLVAYGTCARIAHAAVDVARERGLRVGLFRPVSLWPFPYDALQQTAEGSLRVLTIEMSLGQMVEDVRLAILGAKPVHFYGRTGGMTPTPREVLDEIERIVEEGI
ncbi:MAG: 3-methyl-2-oxobutanoate dehydrogenase subunit VorB [Firmicutes bacterium]|jgi:2-oxoglutarate ferredoxin oxidoreductase subunit alpha|nr:3-methyl-2-oxobutanoate dehydrogenase subunit VorB [Bacillota bacterium]